MRAYLQKIWEQEIIDSESVVAQIKNIKKQLESQALSPLPNIQEVSSYKESDFEDYLEAELNGDGGWSMNVIKYHLAKILGMSDILPHYVVGHEIYHEYYYLMFHPKDPRTFVMQCMMWDQGYDGTSYEGDFTIRARFPKKYHKQVESYLYLWQEYRSNPRIEMRNPSDYFEIVNDELIEVLELINKDRIT